MITSKFAYETPASATEAAEILARAPEATTILGGGTWVVPELSQHKRRAEVVIDLRRADLSSLVTDGETISIGAATTYSTLIGHADTPALLRELALGVTGGAQVRNQGTIGGSACYANPASDVPGGIVALQARMVIRSSTGVREVPVRDFFVAPFTTCLNPDEMLEALVIDRSVADRPGAHLKFKVAQGSWPIVTASCVAEADGTVATVVIGGAAQVPLEVAVPEGDDLAATVRSAITEPWEDVLASGNFRRHVAGVLAERVVQRVRTTANGEPA